MTDCKKFQTRILRAFSGFGFRGSGRTRRYFGEEIDILINVQQAYSNCFINVGFVIKAIDNDLRERVEKTHMYYRLERIFPDLRETIIAAGELKEDDSEEYRIELITLIKSDLAEKLCRLSILENLKLAFTTGNLENGLVTGNARLYLSKK